MRFLSAHIFGYGKFVSHFVKFTPGFQVIYGPNESGKTTLLNFLLDAIFGQKTSLRKGAPLSENYYLYKPWSGSEYKGELSITLDTQNLLLLRRNFGNNGALLVLEGINPIDVTNRYPLLPNGDVAFAQKQFGMNRDVFTSVATISIKTLDQLGSPDAVRRIKEHLIRLIDTGSLESSLEEILMRLGNVKNGYFYHLNSYVDTLKNNMSELKSLLDEQVKLRREYFKYKRESIELHNQIICLEEELEKLKGEIEYTKKYILWRKKNDAKALKEQLDKLTSEYFAYSGVKDFPIHLNTQLVQLTTSHTHYLKQRESLQKEIENLTEEIDELENILKSKKFVHIDNINQIKERFSSLCNNILKLEAYIEEKNNQISNLQLEIEKLEETFRSNPELSKVDHNLVKQVEANITIYNTYIYTISSVEENKKELKRKIQDLNYEIHPLRKIFGSKTDILEEVEEYERLITEPQKIIDEIRSKINQEMGFREKCMESKMWDPLIIGICAMLSVGSLLWLLLTSNDWILMKLIFFAGCAYLLVYFIVDYHRVGKYIAVANENIKNNQEKIKEIESGAKIASHPVSKMMQAINAKDTSELLGVHKKYTTLLKELEKLNKEITKVDQELLKLDETKKSIFLQLKDLFATVGLNLEKEDEIDKMRQEVIRRKDKANELNHKIYELNKQISELKIGIEINQKDLDELKSIIKREIYDKVGPYFVEMGLLASDTQISMDTFLSYFSLQAEIEGLRGKVFQKRKERERLYQELQQVEDSLSSTDSKIQDILDLGGVKTLEEWELSYEKARKAKEISEHIEKVNAELRNLLGEYSLSEIEEKVKDFVPLGEPNEELGELEKKHFEKQAELEGLKQQFTELNFKMIDVLRKMKDIIEIEEETQHIKNKIFTLEIDMEALEYAVSTIKRISSDKELQILSKLENEVSEMFSRITNKRYSAVKFGRNLSPQVYCAEKGKYLPLEELNLSQGTIDQLYFCIRVAILRTICSNGEKLPMILDDPFLNYDVERLTRSIQTLKELGKEHQILFFTCREEVLTLAKLWEIPVINM